MFKQFWKDYSSYTFIILNPFTPKISSVILLQCLPYNSYDVSSDNLLLDQLLIPLLTFVFFLITCLLDIVLIS